MMMNEPKLQLNQRIQIGEDRGTILYIGEVTRIKGEVLGIEWDNPERGKHSGNFEGTQYFQTSKPNSGSFLKSSTLTPSQITPQTPKEYCLGTDLFHSIVLKYATFDNNSKEEVKLNNSSKIVEVIGFEKSFNRQKMVENLKVISLINYCIGWSEDVNKLKILTSLEDLNLSSNLLNDWNIISEIVKELENLKVLNLSDNIFKPLTNPLSSHNFINLKSLMLNKTKINWEQLGLLEPSLQNLSQLDLKDNELIKVEFKPSNQSQSTWFPNLLELNLHFNEFTESNSLEELKRFPKLKKLALSFNKLKYFSDPSSPKLINEGLEELHIDENPLSDWLSISLLNISFPNLNTLKLFPNSLINDDFAIGRANTLGKLLKLTRLNGSDITLEERKDWERYYLSKIIASDLPTLNQYDFNLLHPNYKELVERHGEVQVQKPKVDDTKLKNRLKTLNFHLVKDLENLEPIQSISKSVLSNLTILQLQTLIVKLFKLKTNLNQLTLFPLNNSNLIFDLKSRNLDFYGIEEGQDIGFFY